MKKRIVTLFMALALVALPLTALFSNPKKVYALAISSMSITGTNIASNSSAISTAITPTFNFTLGTALSAAQALVFSFTGNTVNNGITVSAAGGLASADITPGGGCSGTPVLSGTPIAQNTVNPTLSITGLTCTTAASTIAIAAAKVQTNTQAGNTTIAITTPVDQGAFLYYIGNANQVTVTATVLPTLTFVLRAADDNSDLSPGTSTGARTCAMGNLAVNTTPVPAGANSCQYRLRFSTNAANGLTIAYSSTSVDTVGGGFQRLAKSTTVNIPNQTGGTSGNSLSATAGYGVQISTPTGTTRGTNFGSTAANFYNITSSSSDTMYTTAAPFAPASAPDTTLTALVTHGARIANTQATGVYTHTVTYTATGSF